MTFAPPAASSSSKARSARRPTPRRRTVAHVPKWPAFRPALADPRTGQPEALALARDGTVIYMTPTYGRPDLEAAARKGSAELLILAALEDGQLHGYDIAREITRRSDGLLTFHVASLYPLLYKLEDRGWISGTLGGEGRPAPAAVLPADRRRQARAGRAARPLVFVRARSHQSRRTAPCVIGWRRSASASRATPGTTLSRLRSSRRSRSTSPTYIAPRSSVAASNAEVDARVESEFANIRQLADAVARRQRAASRPVEPATRVVGRPLARCVPRVATAAHETRLLHRGRPHARRRHRLVHGRVQPLQLAAARTAAVSGSRTPRPAVGNGRRESRRARSSSRSRTTRTGSARRRASPRSASGSTSRSTSRPRRNRSRCRGSAPRLRCSTCSAWRRRSAGRSRPPKTQPGHRGRRHQRCGVARALRGGAGRRSGEQMRLNGDISRGDRRHAAGVRVPTQRHRRLDADCVHRAGSGARRPFVLRGRPPARRTSAYEQARDEVERLGATLRQNVRGERRRGRDGSAHGGVRAGQHAPHSRGAVRSRRRWCC